jgi:hypothetical protein
MQGSVKNRASADQGNTVHTMLQSLESGISLPPLPAATGLPPSFLPPLPVFGPPPTDPNLGLRAANFDAA